MYFPPTAVPVFRLALKGLNNPNQLSTVCMSEAQIIVGDSCIEDYDEPYDYDLQGPH